MSASNLLSNVSLTATTPTGVQVPYTPPSIPTLLSLSTFLVLLALPSLLSNAYLIHPPRCDIMPEPRNRKSRSYTLDASLTIILPLLLGTLFGPSITSNSILSSSTQITLINIGYIGLLLLIFEAGVSLDATSLQLMKDNAALICVAITGALVPIAISMGLGLGAYDYSWLQSFASGTSLASTSLGTTLALLASSSAPKLVEKRTLNGRSEGEHAPAPKDMDLRRTRVGCVLICAALLDDILGLVIAGIIPDLAQTSSEIQTKVKWSAIVRPVLVSAAFGLGTSLAAMSLRWILDRFSARTPRPQYLFVVIILTLTAFIAGSGYAGTSELFGAYLAGAFLSHISPSQDTNAAVDQSLHAQSGEDESGNPVHAAFVTYLQPILTHLLAPLFFGSIGAALPVKAMFTTYPNAVQIVSVVHSGSDSTTTIHVDSGNASHQVVWRGIVYAVLMVVGKMVVGLWMLIWPVPKPSSAGMSTGNCPDYSIAPSTTAYDVERAAEPHAQIDEHSPQQTFQASLSRNHAIASREPATHILSRPATSPREPTLVRSALLLGLAMVARGEIALIIAQLARPLLIGPAAPSTTTMSASGQEATSITRTAVPDVEPFAVVIWAILISTVGGAIGVGLLVASWKKIK